MAELTGIEWCDATFNPWIGCSKVSPGCAHCYAETLVHGRMGRGGTWGDDGVRQVTSKSNWKKPLRWARLAREGRLPDGSENPNGHRPRVFCASLADVFEPRPELSDWRDDLFTLIEQTLELDWLLLTKRPEFARDWLAALPLGEHGPVGFTSRVTIRVRELGFVNAFPNVWIGTSIENARHNWRADVLREIPAAIRFLSCEPLLGSLFETRRGAWEPCTTDCAHEKDDELRVPGWLDGAPLHFRAGDRELAVDLSWADSLPFEHRRVTTKPLDLTGIGWVIVGGESGGGARPFHVEHAREILAACRAAGVAAFVKQLGARPVLDYDVDGHPCSAPVFGVRDRKGGDWTEWDKVPDLRIREFPASAAVLKTAAPGVGA